ncbi:hypothetical protein [Leptospira noguchii]|uniref:hypothetical protein n=1 Tax=Leptospira noguchii TaxID=28182 RepID=UPI0002F0AD3E|nr:hypothetical protein [Leptospira noguchii]
MNNFYRQFISHITVVYVVVLSHDITGGAAFVQHGKNRFAIIMSRKFNKAFYNT